MEVIQSQNIRFVWGVHFLEVVMIQRLLAWRQMVTNCDDTILKRDDLDVLSEEKEVIKSHNNLLVMREKIPDSLSSKEMYTLKIIPGL